jgi:hypothetical protein
MINMEEQMKSHKAKTEELARVELELANLLIDKGDEVLTAKFIEWQGHREICNYSYIDMLERFSSSLNKNEK